MKTLGFIGTGGMGSGMAANLIKAGNKLVVNDLRREQAKGARKPGRGFQRIAQGGGRVLRDRALHAAV